MTAAIMARATQAASSVRAVEARGRRSRRLGEFTQPDDGEDAQGDQHGHGEEVLDEPEGPARGR